MTHLIRKALLLLLFVALPGFYAMAASVMNYRVQFDTHKDYLEVELSASDLSSGETLFKLPVWAPGYYLIVDFPKNLSDFRVTDVAGAPLPWTKVGKNGWLVANGTHSQIKVSYRIYANSSSVAESLINNERAFVAPNGVFMYVEGEKESGTTIEFAVPSNWKKASTGLSEVEGQPFTFVAPNFDTLYDSPLLFGNQATYDFEVDGLPYHLALETPDGVEQTTFIEDLKKMIHTTTTMMGHVPYNRYAFILLGAGRGGLEHLNSQACFTNGNFKFKDEADYKSFLSFITHEFFHLYNVKAIRPIELGPFNYDAEVFTPGLWISEGFTVYYESALLYRAGLMSKEEVLKALSRFISSIEGNEGRKHMSLRESSYDIWLNFFNRNANGDDVRVSYYQKGPILGLLMDIEIRHLTKNKKSLDDVMRTLYNTYYLGEGRGFTEEEFWTVCADVAGEPLTEMRRYVDTPCDIDYPKYLGYAGLTLTPDYKLKELRKDSSTLLFE